MVDLVPQGFDFGRPGLVLLTGVSGSGKTTRISRLLAEHPELRDRAITRIAGAPIVWSEVIVTTKLAVLDELVCFQDLWRVLLLLKRGHCVIAASHLAEPLVKAAACLWLVCALRTDLDPDQVCDYLARRGVVYSTESVAEFCLAFSSSFIDAELVLERCNTASFDEAWHRFKRHASIKREFPIPLFGA